MYIIVLIWVLLCIIGLILLKYVNLKRLKEKFYLILVWYYKIVVYYADIN